MAGQNSPLTIQDFMFNEGVPQDVTNDGQVQILAPTAASVSVGGKLFSSGGMALNGETVILTDSNGETRSIRSSSFGYYRFDELTAGATYTISVSSKRYTFTPQAVIANESIDSMDLYAQP